MSWWAGERNAWRTPPSFSGTPPFPAWCGDFLKSLPIRRRGAGSGYGSAASSRPMTMTGVFFSTRIVSSGWRPPTLGVLVLKVDPEKYLYPFIVRWPTASRTAETLIVRRDGNDALFLNELRFQKNAALNLRIPLERRDVPRG